MVTIRKNLIFVGLLFFILTVTVVMCGKVPIKKRSLVAMEGDGREAKDQKPRPNKRTFCNAFTGCQGKRSDPSIQSMKDYDYGTGKDGMEENSVDDVARDILAEARLWEAFQARNSLYPMQRRQAFFGREKRAAQSDDDSLETAAVQDGLKKE